MYISGPSSGSKIEPSKIPPEAGSKKSMWWRYVPLKCRALSELYHVTTQTTVLLIVTAILPSNRTRDNYHSKFTYIRLRTLVFCVEGLRNEMHSHVRPCSFHIRLPFPFLSLSLPTCDVSPGNQFRASRVRSSEEVPLLLLPPSLTPPRITCTSFGRPNLLGVNCTAR